MQKILGVTLSLAANIAALSPLKTLCTVLCKALYSRTPSLPDILQVVLSFEVHFGNIGNSHCTYFFFTGVVFSLVVCFANFPIKIPSLWWFNSTAENVRSSLPRHFQCLQIRGWVRRIKSLTVDYVQRTSSADNCSNGLGSLEFPSLSSLPSLKSCTILLP